ncbi:pyridoxal 5'-phosphate synthase glutaminase subunit PdxT [Aerococcus urinae]|uniref:Pyridoxal 5'-phosphate synthase subunit PdxT n=1 Tax=Aerococcus urinae TaxID=1376 RepID=A0A7T2VTN8_9LACT|nr:pyridoxal 5'-phosphate synthase glutaminase subunit PdxT [Aerococcus urinae]AMB96064.1 glutamine amidotransferase [Aerococcus urinae]QPS02262.1 pyridoxal 5'-phosphate synthase glutaminase subunit PdxT [Aerococcus urinae]
MTVGVLALQGAFIEHEDILRRLGAQVKEIRQLKDLDDIDGLVLPGGESTVQGQLLEKLGLLEPLRQLIQAGLPTLATCAGLILLADDLANDSHRYLGTLPVTVKRNAYGRQLGSFATQSQVGPLSDYPAIFIRAPYIADYGPAVEVLSQVDGKVVGVEYENQIGLAFHPELTQDYRIHQYFLQKVEAFKQAAIK